MLNHTARQRETTGVPVVRYLLAAVLIVWIANSFFLQTRNILYHNDQADIAAYFAAADVKWNSSGSVYDSRLLNEVGLRRQVGSEVRPYIYPPLLAEVLAPASLLPYRWFRILFLLGMHALLAAFYFVTVSLIRRQFPSRYSDTVPLVTLLVFVVSSALERDLFTGQINILLALIIAAAFLMDSRKHFLLIGVFVALGAVTKVFLAVFLVYFLYRRQYRAALAGAVFTVVFVASSVVIFGADDWVTYGREILPSFAFQIYPSDVAAYTDLTTSNYSILNFLYLLALGFGSAFSQETLAALHKVLALGVTVVLGRILWSGRRLREHPVIEMQLLFCFTMLLSPIVWNHWFVYTIPGLVYALCLYLAGGVARRQAGILITAFVLISVADYGPNLPLIHHGPLLLLKLLKLYGLILLTWFFADLFRQRARSAAVDLESGVA